MTSPRAHALATTIIVTEKGYQALVNAEQNGTAPILLAAIGVTAQAFVPDPAMSDLPGEFKRLTTIAGGATAPDILHVQLVDDSDDAYEVRGFGLYLEDGMLFAVWGQADVLVAKSGQAVLRLGTDVKFANIDASHLTFGDTNFDVPGATVERRGIAKLATKAQAVEGDDGETIITPATLQAAIEAALAARSFYQPGDIVVTAGDKPPPGTLVCDGSYVSRTAYPRLFAVLRSRYGSGIDTFRLPYFAEGTAPVHTNNYEKVGTVTHGANLSHTHTATTAPGGAHDHGVAVQASGAHAHAASSGGAGDHIHPAWTDAQGHHGHSGGTTWNGDHAHGSPDGTAFVTAAQGNVGYQGGSNPRMNQVGATTTVAGGHAHTFNTDGAGEHAHNVGMNGVGNHDHPVYVAEAGSHDHPVSQTPAADHDHAVTVAHQGGTDNLPAGVFMLTCIAY